MPTCCGCASDESIDPSKRMKDIKYGQNMNETHPRVNIMFDLNFVSSLVTESLLKVNAI